MSTILITGANRGIGLELTKQYAMHQWNVIACCRNSEKARELQSLAQSHSSIRIEVLDVANAASIAALASQLKSTPIDLLFNNAGVYTGTAKQVSAETGDPSQEFGHIDFVAWEKVLRINTIAPIMMIEAFVPHLKKGTGKKIVNITSIMASLSIMEGGSIAYRSSKTALNAAMLAIAPDLRELGLMIVNLHPGWVITDLGGQGAHLTAEESVKKMRKTIDHLKPEDSGRILSYDGQPIPW